jgi:histidinol-phosphate aminotransferase
MLVRTFIEPGGRIGGVRPDYLLYETLAQIQGATLKTVPGWPQVPAVAALVELDAPIFLSSPTNPTGAILPLSYVEELATALRQTGQLLVMDEAYVDFANTTALPLIRQHDNLVVLRSFSKSFSLAGMRIGLAFADPAIITQLMKVKDSYNLDRLAIVAGTAALEDLQNMRQTADTIKRTRARLAEALTAMAFDVSPSAANFVLCRPPEMSAPEFLAALREQRILVRHYDVAPIREWVRISVGTDHEIDALLSAVRDILRVRGIGTENA